ncbi:MAG: hypothetical protein J6S14_08570 [Clostridia bacterium]|nr:hypothetical protein [Clostridia bacterium]
MSNNGIERRKNMLQIMSQNEEFIVVGLTGRIGSGCTETAKILASDFRELELPEIQPGSQGFATNEERERRILKRYAGVHWIKFDVIKTRSIISCYLLDELETFLKKLNGYSLEDLYKKMEEKFRKEKGLTDVIDGQQAAKEAYIRSLKTLLKNSMLSSSDIWNELKFNTAPFEAIQTALGEDWLKSEDFFHQCHLAINELGKLYDLPAKTDDGDFYLERSRYISSIEQLLGKISALAAAYLLYRENAETIGNTLRRIKESIDNSALDGTCSEAEGSDRYERFVFVHDIVDIFSDTIHDLIVDAPNYDYTDLYQKYGNSIRCYGKIHLEAPTEEPEREFDIFSIPEKIVKFIKILRHPFYIKDKVRPVRIAIDSIKSVFEADYLRQRYSSFYLFAISTSNEIRKNRLMNGENKGLTMQQIKFSDWNEYSSEGYKIFEEKGNAGGAEKAFLDRVCEATIPFSHDYVRQYAYENKLYKFYLQDVGVSIENADIFISNNYSNTISKNMELRWSVVRNICLIMFPGLLTPTPIERCMQIAFAAKCNSGCLSRQVGAVVTDKEYNILSIGWNDVPCGDISCSHKNLVDLCKWEDKAAYSNYELENPDFRDRIKKFEHQKVSKILVGLPMRYCFKDIHSDKKNPMRSRAMHAEEKALALCGEMCKEGYLFTTSSPCEMCSKNAKNHKIKKIYYIELYPGISESQYTKSGDKNNIAEHILFTGAIGRAYTKMYTPFMPQKDILNMLGVNDKCWKRSDKKQQKD